MSSTATVYIDGASRGNPGHAAFGVLAVDGAGEVERFGAYIGRQTNNVAEYRGLLAALQWAHENGIDDLEVISDSQLLVRQMNGQYRVKSPGLKPLFFEASGLAGRLLRCTFCHVRRDENVEADSIANEILDARSV